MTTLLLSLFAALSLSVLLRAESQGLRRLSHVAKPLTLVAIGLLALYAWPAVSAEYRLWILVGLGLSLVGDLFLMMPRDRFVPGLAAFLAAHLSYIMAFAGRLDTVPVLPFLPYAITAAFVVLLLWPHLGRLKVPVILYAAALAAMAGAALAAAVSTGSPTAWLAALGAALFVLSDTALAFNRFVGEFGAAHKVVLLTYFPAQWMIAYSVFA